MTETRVKLGADQDRWRQIEGGWELRFERRLRHTPAARGPAPDLIRPHQD